MRLLSEVPYLADTSRLFDGIASNPWAVFLDSGRPGSATGRYDIVASDPGTTLVTRGGVQRFVPAMVSAGSRGRIPSHCFGNNWVIPNRTHPACLSVVGRSAGLATTLRAVSKKCPLVLGTRKRCLKWRSVSMIGPWWWITRSNGATWWDKGENQRHTANGARCYAALAARRHGRGSSETRSG